MTGSEDNGQRRRKRSTDFETDKAPYFTVNEWVRKFGHELQVPFYPLSYRILERRLILWREQNTKSTGGKYAN